MEKLESKLRGTLLKKKEVGLEISVGSKLIQRDSHEEYIVDQINSTEHGDRIVLKRVGANVRITLDKWDLLEKLNTPGSPWKRKQ